jgi:hypothetical protein
MSNIPTSAEDRKAILTALDQISAAMSDMQTQREQIREILKALERQIQAYDKNLSQGCTDVP